MLVVGEEGGSECVELFVGFQSLKTFLSLQHGGSVQRSAIDAMDAESQ
jgi:hypothetical protein